MGFRPQEASFKDDKGAKMAGKLTGATVIFDLDGTLVDTAADLAVSMNVALAGDGYGPVPPADVRHLVGYGARRMLMHGYEVAAGCKATEATLDGALHRFLTHYEQNIAIHSRPFAGAVEMIEALRADGARTAICTNKREAMAVLLIDTLGLSPLFDAIVGADTASAPKPDAAPVQLCLQRTAAKRAVFIGDSDTDIKAAEAADIPCLVVDFGYGPLTLQDKAAGIFSDYRAASSLIKERLAAG